MGINARLQSDSGDVLGDPRMILSRAAQREFTGTRLLKYLRPWGDAIFNQAQADDLQTDIVEVMKANPGTPLCDILSEIRPLVARLSHETHAYIWFIGD